MSSSCRAAVSSKSCGYCWKMRLRLTYQNQRQRNGTPYYDQCVQRRFIKIDHRSAKAPHGAPIPTMSLTPDPAVMPYFPYSRQSKKKSHRGAITARMLANLMNVAGVNHVVTVDLHASQMQGFFKCPVDNLMAQPLLAKYIKSNIRNWQEAVVVSKNPGGTKRATSLADHLKLSFGIVTTDSRRSHGSSSMVNSMVLDSLVLDIRNNATADHTLQPSPRERVAGSIELDFAPRHGNARSRGNTLEDSAQARNGLRTGPLNSSSIRRAFTSGEMPSSPLSKTVRQESIDTSDAPPIANLRWSNSAPEPSIQARAHDGYESSDDDDEADEVGDVPLMGSANDAKFLQRPRDVIRSRLFHGHIVDDAALSPTLSARSTSPSGNHSGQHRSSDEEAPDQMIQSFMSTASSRVLHGHGLGGTGDATASDEEEEEALQNPDIETTVTLVGNVREKPVLIIDDMIDKAGSWIAAAETVVKRGGATEVYCIATHGLFGGDSLRELEECEQITAVIVTDAFPIPEYKRRGIRKLVVLDISGLLAEAIRRNHHGESLRQLYQYFE